MYVEDNVLEQRLGRRKAMIYGILLAAGMSSRMGQPKQLLDWNGQPLVRHVAEQALSSMLDGLVVVTGCASTAILAALVFAESGSPGRRLMCIVENSNYAAGEEVSLWVGLEALPVEAEAAVVLLVDQPFVTQELIDRIVTAFRDAQEAAADIVAVVPCCQGQQGNPVLLARRLFAEVQTLQGDQGTDALLQQHASCVYWLDVADPAVIMDADTVEEYEALRHHSEQMRNV